MTSADNGQPAGKNVLLGLLGSVEQIGPLLRDNTARADHDRRLPQSSVRALEEIGAFRLTTPARYGGLDLGIRAVVEAARSIGRWCPAAGWITMISSAASLLASRFPDSVLERVFADGPCKMSAMLIQPAGGAARPDGAGFRVSGRWPYASNIHDAQWAIGMVPLERDGGTERAFVLVPRADWTVEETWFTIGMRGTGSDTMVLVS